MSARYFRQNDVREHALPIPRSKLWRFLKRAKVRLERRRIRRDIEATPGYGRYRGWMY